MEWTWAVQLLLLAVAVASCVVLAAWREAVAVRRARGDGARSRLDKAHAANMSTTVSSPPVADSECANDVAKQAETAGCCAASADHAPGAAEEEPLASWPQYDRDSWDIMPALEPARTVQQLPKPGKVPAGSTCCSFLHAAAALHEPAGTATAGVDKAHTPTAADAAAHEDFQTEAQHCCKGLAAPPSLADIVKVAQQGGTRTRYVSRRRNTVHFKIPGFQPSDMFDAEVVSAINESLSASASHFQVVGISARAGCIELVLDLCPLNIAEPRVGNEELDSAYDEVTSLPLSLVPNLPSLLAALPLNWAKGNTAIGQVNSAVYHFLCEAGAPGCCSASVHSSDSSILDLSMPSTAEFAMSPVDVTCAAVPVLSVLATTPLVYVVEPSSGAAAPAEANTAAAAAGPAAMADSWNDGSDGSSSGGDGSASASRTVVRLDLQLEMKAPAASVATQKATFTARLHGTFMPCRVVAWLFPGAAEVTPLTGSAAVVAALPETLPMDAPVNVTLEVDISGSSVAHGWRPSDLLLLECCCEGSGRPAGLAPRVYSSPLGVLLVSAGSALEPLAHELEQGWRGDDVSKDDHSSCMQQIVLDLGTWLQVQEAIEERPSRPGRTSKDLSKDGVGAPSQSPAVPPLSRSSSSTSSWLRGQLQQQLRAERASAHFVPIGAQLLGAALELRWPRMAETVLGGLLRLPGCRDLDAVDAAVAANNDGRGLLHCAVLSASVQMVQLVEGWEERHGGRAASRWATATDKYGVTPLMYAAVTPQAVKAACCVLRSDAGVRKAWYRRQGRARMIPAELCAAADAYSDELQAIVPWPLATGRDSSVDSSSGQQALHPCEVVGTGSMAGGRLAGGFTSVHMEQASSGALEGTVEGTVEEEEEEDMEDTATRQPAHTGQRHQQQQQQSHRTRSETGRGRMAAYLSSAEAAARDDSAASAAASVDVAAPYLSRQQQFWAHLPAVLLGSGDRAREASLVRYLATHSNQVMTSWMLLACLLTSMTFARSLIKGVHLNLISTMLWGASPMVSVALSSLRPATFAKWRELLLLLCTAGRMMCFLGIALGMPTLGPNLASFCLLSADILADAVIPALAERVRVHVVLPLRVADTAINAGLYWRLGVFDTVLAAVLRALLKSGVWLVVAAGLEMRCRQLLASRGAAKEKAA